MTTPTIRELEERLSAARDLVERANVRVVGKHHGGTLEDYRTKMQALLSAERDLALAREEARMRVVIGRSCGRGTGCCGSMRRS